MKKLIFLIIILLTANAVYAATLFYLPTNEAAAILPTFESTWNNASNMDRLKCDTIRQASPFAVKSYATTASYVTYLTRQYISDPIIAQTISGWVSGEVSGSRNTGGTLQVSSEVVIKIVSSSGITRKVILPSIKGTSVYPATTAVGKWTPPPTQLSTGTSENGDRIVIEIGVRRANGTPTVSQTYGDNSATLLVEGNNTVVSPWILFSNDIIFTSARVINPNGGEVLIAGKKYNVNWNISGEAAKVIVKLSTNEGASWGSTLTTETWAHSGLCTYEWTVPSVASTNCRISVEAQSNSTTSDAISSTHFEIKMVTPTVEVIQPNGGELLYAGSKYKLMWTITPDASSVKVRLSTNGGTSWSTLLTSESWTHAGLCTYEWTVPVLSSSNCLVSVEAMSSLWGYDKSNSTFTIITSTDVWVSTTGSDDAGNGTISSPFLTISKALQNTAAGGTVHAFGGKYNQYNISWPNTNNLTLKGSLEASPVTIDAGAVLEQRCIEVPNAVNLTLESITLQSGRTNGNGGCMRLSANNTTLWLKKVIVRICSAESGSSYGGAIWCNYDTGNWYETINIHADQCVFENNWSGYIGGMAVDGSWEVTNSVIRNNYCAASGAVCWAATGAGTWTLSNCTIESNYAAGSGGVTSSTPWNMKDCTVNNNSTAGQGGFSDACSLVATNCVFSNNSANNSIGGGVAYVYTNNVFFPAFVMNCTFYKNSAPSGPGGVVSLYNDGTIGPSWESVNCIYYGNSASSKPVFGGTLPYNAYTIKYCDIQANDFKIGTGNISAEPAFASTAEGNIKYLQLTSASPCKDTGTSTGAPSTDIVGVSRPQPPGGAWDMGAYEYLAPEAIPPVVTVEAPNGGETWEVNSLHNITWNATDNTGVDHVNIYYTTNEGSTWITITSDAANSSPYSNWTSSISSNQYKIRIQALDAAGNIGTDESNSNFTFAILSPEVWVSPSGSDGGSGTKGDPYGTIAFALNKVATGGTVEAFGGTYNEHNIAWPNTNYITLRASLETSPATIDAGSAHNQRCIKVDYVLNLTLEGITLQHGMYSSYPAGGGIYVKNGCTVWLKNSTIRDCSAESGYDGGAIGIEVDGNLTNVYLESCLLKNNSAISDSGGISIGGIWHLNKSKFIGNYASQGGVVLGGTVTATNCVFADNSTGSDGGVAQDGNWNVYNCSFSGNHTASYGGVFNGGGNTFTARNSIFWNNSAPHGPAFGLGTITVTYSDIQPNDFKTGAGNISVEPSFVSTVEPYDLSLKAGSLCVDKGTSESAPSVDIAGNPRPVALGYDMGAYEFQGPSVQVIKPNGGELATAETIYKIVFKVSPEADEIYIRLSTDSGSTWSQITHESGSSLYTGVSTYEWTVNKVSSTTCMISVEAKDNNIWNFDASDATFEVKIPPLLSAVWVSTTGFDTGEGTISDPYRTIAHALTRVATGGSINAFGGTYNEHSLKWPNINDVTLKASSETSPATIDAQSLDRVISVESSVSLTIEGFTIKYGKVTGKGGGIYLPFSGTNLHLTNVSFLYCTAEGNPSYGGAIYAVNQSVTIEASECYFRGNSAYNGGGVAYSGRFIVERSKFISNNAYYDGGVAYLGTWEATNCIFYYNIAAPAGSGGVAYAGTWAVKNCTFYLNQGVHGGVVTAANWTDINSVYRYNNSLGMVNIWGPIFWSMSSINDKYSNLQWNDWVVDTGNISSEPIFVSSDPTDPGFLKLYRGAHDIDTGTSEGAPTVDYGGDPRPRGFGYDMGAYEFQGPSVRVIAPNGGESYNGGEPITITWSVTDEVYGILGNSISIEYSSDSGAHFIRIASDEANTGIFTWEAPLINSKYCLILVEATNNGSVVNSDTSDNQFTIAVPSSEVWVSTAGNDDGSGTIGDPYRTIAFALTRVATGGAVKAFGGTYSEHNILWPNKNYITLKASNETSPATIDAQSLGRGISVESALNLTLEGITITKGRLTNIKSGGGIYLPIGSTLWLDQVTISYCTVEGVGAYGGAVYSDGASVNVSNSRFIGNRANTYGGGVALGGTWKVASSTFSGNLGDGGGGVALRSTWEVMDSSFINNSALGNYGGVADYGTWIVTNCAFSGNNCNNGGVISRGTWTIINSTFYNNSASGGVAVASKLTVINSIFAGGSGTKFYNMEPGCTMRYSDVDDGEWNDFTRTGCIAKDPKFASTIDSNPNFLRLSPGSPCIDTASIEAPSPDLAGSIRPRGFGNDMGAYEFTGPSVIVHQPSGGEEITRGVPYNITWSTSPESVNNVNFRLSTNGGLTWDLIASEPGAHSAGISTYEWTPGDGFFSDQCLISVEAKGITSNKWGGGRSPSVFTLSGALAVIFISPSGSDEAPDGTGSYQKPYRTIQKALDMAADGADIRMLPGTYTLEASAYVNYSMANWPNTDNITLRLSPEATGPVTVDARTLGRLINVTTPVKLKIEGITMKNGRRVSGYGLNGSGGCIYLESGASLEIDSCVVSNNHAYDLGGAIYSLYSTVIAVDSTFTGNSVDGYGGVIDGYSYDPSESTSVFIASNSVFRSNTTYYGGVCDSMLSFEATGCTFESNFADGGRGGVFSYIFNVSSVNCLFISNEASDSGGVAYFDNPDETWTISGCTFRDNISEYEGAISYIGITNVTSSEFINNTVSDDYGDAGIAVGAIWTISDCTFEGNSGGWEGGCFDNCDVSAVNSDFKGNNAQEGGVAANYTNFNAVDCSFSNNAGAYDGGVFSQVTGILSSCVFANNSSESNAGVSNSSNLTLYNCSLYGNTAPDGGVSYTGSLTLFNCSIYNNTATDYGVFLASNIYGANNIFWNNTAPGNIFPGCSRYFTYSDIQPDSWYSNTGNISVEPNFVSTNESLTTTFLKLGLGSKCIDAGTSTDAPLTDFDGNPRPNGFGFDMGMYEFRGPSVVLIRPNGGERIPPDISYPITWKTSPESVTNVKIWLSTNEGATWDLLIASEPGSHPAGISTFEWTTDTGLISNECLISVEALGASSGIWGFGESSLFELLGQKSIIYVSPSGSDEAPDGDGSYQYPYRTIQKGVDSVIGWGEVRMLPGVYTLEASEYVNNSMVNWPNTSDITLMLSPDASEPATIDAQSLGRLISLEAPVTLTIKDITMQNGKASNNGGGIYLSGSVLTLDNLTIASCTADSATNGGIFYCPDGIVSTIDAENCTFRANSAQVGGVSYNPILWTAADCTFESNHADSGGINYGSNTWNISGCVFKDNTVNSYGGVSCYGTWNVTSSEFSNNHSSYGAGVAYQGAWTVLDCSFESNGANTVGGCFQEITVTAINSCFNNNSSYYGGVIQNYTFNATDCAFISNSAGEGGVFRLVSSGILLNCDFANNSASAWGGVSEYCNFTQYNCLFHDNTAAYGGVSFNENNYMFNCTAFNNHASTSAGVAYWSNYAGVNNIFWNNTSPDNIFNASGLYFTYSDVQPDGWYPNTGNISVEPNFVTTDATAASFLKLGIGSKCIDTGTGTLDGAPFYDHDNNPRPRGFGYDMGVYEFQGPSVALVHPNGGERIPPNTPYPITWKTSPESVTDVNIWLSSNEGLTWDLLISSEPGSHTAGISTSEWTTNTGIISNECLVSIEVNGASSGLCGIGNSYSVFELLGEKSVIFISPSGSDEAPDGDGTYQYPYRTIQKGLNSVVGWGEVRMLPGVYTLEASEYVSNSMINWPNTSDIALMLSPEATEPATIDAQSYGRIINVSNPVSLEIIGVTIQNGKISGNCGGIYFTSGAVLTLKDSIIASCTAEGSWIRGGVFYYPSGGRVTIDAENCVFKANYSFYGGVSNGNILWAAANCTFEGNYANNGAVDYYGPAWAANNCTFRDNRADSGGVFASTTGILTDCVFANNSAAYYGGVSNSSNLTLYNCTLYGNTSNSLGGVSVWENMTLNNCTVYNNQATASGGVAYGSTFYGVNNIFWNNPTPGNPFDGCSLNNITYSDTDVPPFDWFTYIGNISADPNFVSTNESLATFLRLGAGSGCIDSGTSEGALPQDKIGNHRPRGLGVDMGAYEFQGPSVKVLVPNGGETYGLGNKITITWIATDEYGIQTDSINIRYSTNGGSSWNDLELAHANSGIFTWESPSIPSSRYLISIEAINGSSEFNCDASDDIFSFLLPTVYVSPSGSDETGTGTIESPFRTVQKGLDVIAPNGFVMMMPGVFTLEASEYVSHSMINWPNRQNITLMLSPDATLPATIDAQGLGRAISVEASVNLTIEGITIQNGYIDGNTYPSLVGGGAIKLASNCNLWLTNIRIAACTAEGGADSGQFGRGGAIYAPANNTSRIYANDSVFTGNRTPNGYGGVGFGGIWKAVNCVFSNNTAYYGGVAECTAGAQWESSSGSWEANNCIFINNYSNNVGGVFGSVKFVKMRNSVFMNNRGEYGAHTFAGWDVTYNIRYSNLQQNDYIYDTGNTSAEPNFASTDEASAGYLRPGNGGNLIDSGTADGAPPFDILGNVRPNGLGIDRGIYEFQGPVVRVIYPNGGENFAGGSNVTVQWTATDATYGVVYDSINIRYSYNGGVTWHDIALGQPNTGSHGWTTPDDIASYQYMISVEATGGNLVPNSDASDGTFLIPLPLIYIAPSPTGSDITGTGTIDAPFATLHKGINSVAASGEVRAMSGLYTQEASTFKSGNMAIWPNRTCITLIISPDATEPVTFDALNYGRGILVPNAVQLTIEGVTIKNCVGADSLGGNIIKMATGGNLWLFGDTLSYGQSVGDGGAVQANNANVFATDTVMNNNTAMYGGAFSRGTWVLENCSFESNSGGYNGSSGVSSGSKVTVSNSWFLSNSAGWQANGGITDGDNWTVDNCVFIGNGAHYGGGVIADGSKWKVTNSLFKGNYSNNIAGVIQGASMEATNCTFEGNWAPWGGIGYYPWGGISYFTNCVFNNNYSWYEGGLTYDQPWNVVNCTFYGNTSGVGGVARSSTWTVKNSIFYNNSATSSDPVFAYMSPDITYSDIQPDGFVSGTGNISDEPRFASTVSGEVNFLSLAPRSPCIDAGTFEGAPGDDLSGFNRPHGFGHDMGAYEFRGPSLSLTYPNGSGLVFHSGENRGITWLSSDETGMRPSPLPVVIRYSIDAGSTWNFATSGTPDSGSFTWHIPAVTSTDCLVSIEVFNSSGLWNYDTSDSFFSILILLFPPNTVTAEALPTSSPSYVRLTWVPSTGESFDGYYVFRGLTYESYDPSPLNMVIITGGSYDDENVFHGTDYYYTIKTFANGGYSDPSRCVGAPLIKVTRTVTVDAPIAGGYSKDAHDSVPGSTIKYSIKYDNIGFGLASNMILNDRVPDNTDYKLDSATGEATHNISFSQNSGSTFDYTPAGTYIDSNVTNISWEADNLSSDQNKMATYEVIIR